jgi:hypothetical protein
MRHDEVLLEGDAALDALARERAHREAAFDRSEGVQRDLHDLALDDVDDALDLRGGGDDPEEQPVAAGLKVRVRTTPQTVATPGPPSVTVRVSPGASVTAATAWTVRAARSSATTSNSSRDARASNEKCPDSSALVAATTSQSSVRRTMTWTPARASPAGARTRPSTRALCERRASAGPEMWSACREILVSP